MPASVDHQDTVPLPAAVEAPGRQLLDPVPARVAALPSAPATRRGGPWVVAAVTVAGVAVVGLGIAFAAGVFGGGGAGAEIRGDGGIRPEDDSAQLSADAGTGFEGSQTQAGVDVDPIPSGLAQDVTLVETAHPIGAGRCFATRPTRTTSLTFRGVRYEENNLQCGDRAGSGQASGGFVVVLAASFDGGTITDFTSTVGIDEASDSTAASGEWQASYDGTVICEATLADGSPNTCEAHGLGIPVRPGGELRLTQSVRPADPSSSLWAGFHLPVVTVASAEAGGTSDQVIAEGDPEMALDRIFLEIKVGDYASGIEAEALYDRLFGSGHPLQGNAAFNAGAIRYATGDCAGAYAAFGDAASVPGTPQQDRIRQAAEAAARSGCIDPLSSLVGQ